jgi:hypothetical protein
MTPCFKKEAPCCAHLLGDSRSSIVLVRFTTAPLASNGENVNVFPFLEEYAAVQDIPIATVCTVWENPSSNGELWMLVFHEALFFECILQTDRGKAFVRQHENDFNAQCIYASLKDYSNKLTKAALDSSKLLSYVTWAKIGDGTWKGTAQNFNLHWRDKVHLYKKKFMLLSTLVPTCSNGSCYKTPCPPLRNYEPFKSRPTNTRPRVALS